MAIRCKDFLCDIVLNHTNSEGASIGFIWWALPMKLHSAEAGLEDITALTSMLVLP